MTRVKSEEIRNTINRLAQELRDAKCSEYGYALEWAAQCLEAGIEEIKLWETIKEAI